MMVKTIYIVAQVTTQNAKMNRRRVRPSAAKSVAAMPQTEHGIELLARSLDEAVGRGLPNPARA